MPIPYNLIYSFSDEFWLDSEEPEVERREKVNINYSLVYIYYLLNKCEVLAGELLPTLDFNL